MISPPELIARAWAFCWRDNTYRIKELERKIQECRDKEEVKELLYELRNEIADDEEGEGIKQNVYRLRGIY